MSSNSTIDGSEHSMFFNSDDTDLNPILNDSNTFQRNENAINRLNSSVDLNLNLDNSLSNQSLNNDNHLDLTRDQIIEKFSRDLLRIKLKHSYDKSGIDDILGLINRTSRELKQEPFLPNSYYLVEKKADFKDDFLKTTYGFICMHCKIQINLKQEDKICPSCHEVIVKNELMKIDHFFRFDVEQMIQMILENVRIQEEDSNTSGFIKSMSDGLVYKEYKSLKSSEERIITIVLSSDGMKPFGNASEFEVWPLFLRINELDCPLFDKTFLFANFYGKKKPDVSFYLDNLIDTLSDLFNRGIYVERLKCKVYPMLIVNVFDYPARVHFLNHLSHKADYSCTMCYIKGTQIDRHHHLFTPEADIQLKIKEDILKIIADGNLPFKGKYFYSLMLFAYS